MFADIQRIEFIKYPSDAPIKLFDHCGIDWMVDATVRLRLCAVLCNRLFTSFQWNMDGVMRDGQKEGLVTVLPHKFDAHIGEIIDRFGSLFFATTWPFNVAQRVIGYFVPCSVRRLIWAVSEMPLPEIPSSITSVTQ